jgi:hypothetical protein
MEYVLSMIIDKADETRYLVENLVDALAAGYLDALLDFGRSQPMVLAEKIAEALAHDTRLDEAVARASYQGGTDLTARSLLQVLQNSLQKPR